MALYVYSGNILIVGSGCASDGQSTHSDSPGPSGALSLTVNWTLPTIKAEGSAIGTFAWMRVLYATTEPVNTDPLITRFPYWKWVQSANATSMIVPNLASGTYYVSWQGEDTSGNLSEPSQWAQIPAA